MRLTIRHNFTWVFWGNLLYSLSQLGIIVVLARVLDAAAVGRYALGLAIAGPVFLFSNLSLRAVLATDIRGEFSFTIYRTLRYFSAAVSCFIPWAISIFAGYGPDLQAVVLLVSCTKGLESLSDLRYGLFQREERMDLYARSLILRGVLGWSALAVAVVLSEDVATGILGLLAAWMIIYLLHDLPLGRRLTRQNDADSSHEDRDASSVRLVLQLARRAAPLGLFMLLVSLNTNVPRYFIEYWSGADALGIFTAMASVFVGIANITRALAQAVTPRLAIYYVARRDTDYYRLFRKALLVSASIGITTILAVGLFGEQGLSFAYGQQFATHTDVFVVLAIAGALGNVRSILGHAVTAVRRFDIQPVVAAASVITTVLLSWLLIPNHGLMGAALAVLGAAVVQTAGMALVIFVASRQFKLSAGTELS